MSNTRFHHTRLLVALVGLAALVVLTFSSTANAGAPRRGVEILGFSLRANTPVSRLAEPGGTLTARSCKPRRLYAFVAFQRIRPGTLVKRTWRVNGNLAKRTRGPWEHGRARRVKRIVIANNLSRLPRGRYQLSVKVAGIRARVARVQLTC